MVDCYFSRSDPESYPSHYHQQYEHAAQTSQCTTATTTSQNLADSATREIADYRSYIMEQKELIKKIHMQQKKLKIYHSNSNNNKSSLNSSFNSSSRHASVAHPTSRSCYFHVQHSSSVPPVAPTSKASCSALRHRPSTRSNARQEHQHLASYISTSLNHLDNLPGTDTELFHTSCLDNTLNLNRSINASQFVVFKTYASFIKSNLFN
jgi:hypothetical protein